MGQQNIDMGIQACIWGLVAVMVFTMLYYRGFGLIANLALGTNIILVIGVMSMIPGATMTLPGIAGIVLTVGMAVDATCLSLSVSGKSFATGVRLSRQFTRVMPTHSAPLPMPTSPR